jgi:hypothetical protein
MVRMMNYALEFLSRYFVIRSRYKLLRTPTRPIVADQHDNAGWHVTRPNDQPKDLAYRFRQIHRRTSQGLLVAYGSYEEAPEFSGFDHHLHALQFLLLLPSGEYLKQLEYPGGEYEDEIDLQSEWEALQVYHRLEHKIVPAREAFAALGKLNETEGIAVIHHWPDGLVPTLD